MRGDGMSTVADHNGRPQQWLTRQQDNVATGARLEIPEGGFRVVPVEDDDASSQHKGAPRTPQVMQRCARAQCGRAHAR